MTRPRPSVLLGAVLAALFVLLSGPIASQAQETTPSPYWQARAALLDPESFDYYAGTDWSITVPPGRTWYALNLWHAAVDGVELFQRPLDARNPLPLPPGTVVEPARGLWSFAYISKPEKVTGDERYNDPEALHQERLSRLDGLPQRSLGVKMPARQVRGATRSADFPTDFDAAILVHVSTHDVAWTIFGRPGGGGGLNLDDETSDDHPIRYATATVAPFMRTVFPSIMVRSASWDGFVSQPGLQGSAAVRYVPLPSDW